MNRALCIDILAQLWKTNGWHSESHTWSLESAKIHNLVLSIWTWNLETMELSGVYMWWKLHSEWVLWNVYILCPNRLKDAVWIWYFETKVILLECFKGYWNLEYYVFVCLSGGISVCVYACQDNLGSQTSFNPYKLINVQSCLVWSWCLRLVLFEGSHRLHFVYYVCYTIVYKLFLYHVPQMTKLSSTVDCGGDNFFHALSVFTAYLFVPLQKPEKHASLITCCCSKIKVDC